MSTYKKPATSVWTGRISNSKLYFHEKIVCVDLETDEIPNTKRKTIALLGYQCEEGVRRNNGRIGTAKGPLAIRKMLATLSNHFDEEIMILDTGDIICENEALEKTQNITTEKIKYLIKNKVFTIVLGGGHDLGYAHFNGIKKQCPNKTIGIINLDAHFDLRKAESLGNSGTPFYQIAKENKFFKYLCLGIQKASNNKELYETADELGVVYVENTEFVIHNLDKISTLIKGFIETVDHIYLTIDVDGFSSAYAPGVSAPSPFGFSIDIALEAIKLICESNKLISVDVVELNPKFDIDNCTARLAARLIYSIIEHISVSS